MTEEQQSAECCLLSLVSVQLSVYIQWRLGTGFSNLHTVVVPALSSQLQLPTCRVSQLEPLAAIFWCCRGRCSAHTGHTVCSLVVI